MKYQWVCYMLFPYILLAEDFGQDKHTHTVIEEGGITIHLSYKPNTPLLQSRLTCVNHEISTRCVENNTDRSS